MLMEMYKSAEDFASDKWASEYFSYKRYYRGEGIDEGIVEGRNERNIEIAKNMLDTNAKEDYISKITGLSVDEIRKLKK